MRPRMVQSTRVKGVVVAVKMSSAARSARRGFLPLAAVVLLVASACGSSAPTAPAASGATAAAPTTSAPTASTSAVNAGSTTPGSPPSAGSVPSTSGQVRDITITTKAADGTTLVFDALAAGDPDASAKGKLVLLLHGFPETDEAWRAQLAPLAAAGYYAVAPNQRGYSAGARPAGVDAYSMVNLVGDVLAMATELHADTFHVVGHDWGAAVAWVVAASTPARVASLAAVSVPHLDAFAEAFAAPDGEQVRKSGYMKVFAAPNSEDQFVANDAAGLRIIYGKAIGKEQVDAYVRVLGTKEALGAALNWYRANPNPSSARIGVVHVPTLFIWSTNDVAIARAGADATKSFVDGPYTYEVLEGVSHWIPEEAPDKVRDLLRAHFASLP
jgi:pimeloyl-ACP methyl ester carboxylesterase